jgi:hypothetical protein
LEQSAKLRLLELLLQALEPQGKQLLVVAQTQKVRGCSCVLYWRLRFCKRFSLQQIAEV